MRLLLMLLLCAPVWARVPTVQEVFDRWLAQDRLKAAHIGFLCVRLADGRVLASHDADRLFVPASTAKVMTARAVVAADPSSVRTSVWIQGNELVLWGAGDPELSSAQLRVLAMVAARRCPRVIRRLIVGSRFWDDTAQLGRGWAWDDATEDYSAVISGLTVERGTLNVTVTPRDLGSPAETSVPVNSLAVTGPKDDWEFRRLPGRDGTFLRGEVPPGKPIQTTIASADPDLDAGKVLAEGLAASGVAVHAVERMSTSERRVWLDPKSSAERLAEHASRPIEAILREALARSDNLAMELLIRIATGKTAPPSPPTARLVDGSGLSRYNLLSPRHLVDALTSSAKLRDLMPLAGVEGTMKNRMKDGLAFRQVRAKTGTLSTVSGLAGTLFPDEPERACVFALLTNGYTGPGRELKQAEDVLVEALVKNLKYPYL